jgi:hypothetical protein
MMLGFVWDNKINIRTHFGQGFGKIQTGYSEATTVVRRELPTQH